MYTQRVSYELSNSYYTQELDITAHDYSHGYGICDGDDDLELVDSRNGVDYYFYLFSNGDGELTFQLDNWCITISGEDLTEEDYFQIAYSFEKAGNAPDELIIDEFIFPSLMPFQNVESTSYRMYNYGPGRFQFNIDYKGSNSDFDIIYSNNSSEPISFAGNNDEEVVVEGYDEAYFSCDHLRLSLIKDGRYYVYKADMNTRTMQQLGIENIKEMLIKLAESAE